MTKMTFLSIGRVVTALSLLVCLLSPVYSNTYYVSTTGDDSFSGTKSAPWATPGYGSRQLHPGDSLVITSGTYVMSRFDEDIVIPPSGTSGASITITGQGNSRPVLAGRDNLFSAIILSNTNYVTIENLEITHDSQASGDDVSFRDGINIQGDQPSTHLVLRNLYIHHIDEFGLDAQDVQDVQIVECVLEYCGFGCLGGPAAENGGWRDVLIQKCRLAYSGHYYQGGDGSTRPYDRPDGFGIEPSDGPVQIEDTVCEHNYGDGLDSKAQNTFIRRCIVANNSCDGIKLWGGGSRVENTLIYGRGDGDSTPTPWAAIVIGTENADSDFTITNVTVDDQLGQNYIMYVQYDESTIPINLILRNNIFRGMGSSCRIFLRDVVRLQADHNLFYFPQLDVFASHGEDDYEQANISSLGVGNIYGDPLFVAPAWGSEGDYHVQTGSPAIDHGTETGTAPTDLDGVVRPQGDGIDMGCYELASSAVPVDILAFHAVFSSGEVQLTWRTSGHDNAYAFEVQKSEAGGEFFAIGTVKTDMERFLYVFQDRQPKIGMVAYRLKTIDRDGSHSYSSATSLIVPAPADCDLGQNYPNPFNHSTRIPFRISHLEQVQLRLFNARGQLIRAIAQGKYPAGYYEIPLDASGLSSGVYWIHLNTQSFTAMRKTVLTK